MSGQTFTLQFRQTEWGMNEKQVKKHSVILGVTVSTRQIEKARIYNVHSLITFIRHTSLQLRHTILQPQMPYWISEL